VIAIAVDMPGDRDAESSHAQRIECREHAGKCGAATRNAPGRDNNGRRLLDELTMTIVGTIRVFLESIALNILRHRPPFDDFTQINLSMTREKIDDSQS
jgi:hypothetical protein